MIKEIIVDDLERIVTKLKAVNPKDHPRTVQQYLSQIEKEYRYHNEDAIRYAIKQFWQKELWSKPLIYFLTIISRQHDELEHQKATEVRSLGGIPKNVT